jgi:hypothetical protein
MEKIESLIQGSEKLTNIFGYWPSFHDAEVLELHLWRGYVEPEKNSYIFPILTLKAHVWEMTQAVDERGFFVLRHHTLVTLKFRDVEDLKIDGFNHQNAIFCLSIVQRERESKASPYFDVELEQSFGIGSTFKCLGIEVLEATAWNDDFESHSSLLRS